MITANNLLQKMVQMRHEIMVKWEEDNEAVLQDVERYIVDTAMSNAFTCIYKYNKGVDVSMLCRFLKSKGYNASPYTPGFIKISWDHRLGIDAQMAVDI